MYFVISDLRARPRGLEHNKRAPLAGKGALARSAAERGLGLSLMWRGGGSAVGWVGQQPSFSTADGAPSTRERRVPHTLVDAAPQAAYSPGTSYPGAHLIRWAAGGGMDDGDDGRSGWLFGCPSNPPC